MPALSDFQDAEALKRNHGAMRDALDKIRAAAQGTSLGPIRASRALTLAQQAKACEPAAEAGLAALTLTVDNAADIELLRTVIGDWIVAVVTAADTAVTAAAAARSAAVAAGRAPIIASALTISPDPVLTAPAIQSTAAVVMAHIDALLRGQT